ncbi:hypothetical protein [Enterococcus casseliflavus]|uniref:hypothetical protein n=1 Tax=Enterococcus casseliflavus TaxID=37734 RepID=UPI0022E76513|nr:hypothetical protein [Enterococcus casseliflavus]
MSDKLAVLMEFNGYTKDELEAYLSLKFGSMTKGGMTASILSQSGYEKAKSVIFGQPQLNENQQIVLDWLKKEYFQGYGPAIIRTIHLLQRENSIDISGSKPVTQAYRSLNTAGEALVVKMFADWALEQEEE